MAEKVGFIGLGTMGFPMITSLAKGGVPLVVYDAQPAVMQRAAALTGVEAAASPREVAERCDILFTCLPNNEIVEQVYRGEEGIVQGLRAGAITCDCSTVGPEVSAGLAAELAGKGVQHLATPMLGSKPHAEKGEIFFIVGGPAKALPRLAPLLGIMGRMHQHVGAAGAANQIKLVHNALSGVYYAAGAESLALCAAAGVDLTTFYEVVCNGGGIAYSNYFVRKVPTIIEGDYSPRFKLELELKDLNLAKAFAEQVGVPVPIMDEVRRTFQEAFDDGHGADDASAVTRVIEKRTGRKIGRR